MSYEKAEDSDAIKEEKLSHPIPEQDLLEAANNLSLDKKSRPLPDLNRKCGLNVYFTLEVAEKLRVTTLGQCENYKNNNTRMLRTSFQIPDAMEIDGEFIPVGDNQPLPEVHEVKNEAGVSTWVKTETMQPASAFGYITVADAPKSFGNSSNVLVLSEDGTQFNQPSMFEQSRNGRIKMVKASRHQAYHKSLTQIEKELKNSPDSPRYGIIDLLLNTPLDKYEYHTIGFYGYKDYFTYIDVTNPPGQKLFNKLQEGVELAEFQTSGRLFYKSNYSIQLDPTPISEAKREVSPITQEKERISSERFIPRTESEAQLSPRPQEIKTTFPEQGGALVDPLSGTTDDKSPKILLTSPEIKLHTPVSMTVESQLSTPKKLKRKRTSIPSFLRSEFDFDQKNPHLLAPSPAIRNLFPPVKMASSSLPDQQLSFSSATMQSSPIESITFDDSFTYPQLSPRPQEIKTTVPEQGGVLVDPLFGTPDYKSPEASLTSPKLNSKTPVSMAVESQLSTPKKLKRKRTSIPSFLRSEFDFDRKNPHLLAPPPVIRNLFPPVKTAPSSSLPDQQPSSAMMQSLESITFDDSSTYPQLSPEPSQEIGLHSGAEDSKLSDLDLEFSDISVTEFLESGENDSFESYQTVPVSVPPTNHSHQNHLKSRMVFFGKHLRENKNLTHQDGLSKPLETVEDISKQRDILDSISTSTLQTPFLELSSLIKDGLAESEINRTAVRCILLALGIYNRNLDSYSYDLAQSLRALKFHSAEDAFNRLAYRSVTCLLVTINILQNLSPKYLSAENAIILEELKEIAKNASKSGKHWVNHTIRYPFDDPQLGKYEGSLAPGYKFPDGDDLSRQIFGTY